MGQAIVGAPLGGGEDLSPRRQRRRPGPLFDVPLRQIAEKVRRVGQANRRFEIGQLALGIAESVQESGARAKRGDEIGHVADRDVVGALGLE